MIKRQHIVRDFFQGAEAMREALDLSFKNSYAHKINWQYFCDPQMYTYLRTAPQAVIPKEVLDPFMQRLRLWSLDNLGLVPAGMPYLHLMVNGCRLGLHSDFHNGAWGYVFSLTRWQSRKFSGGETLLFRDGTPSYKKHHVHGEVLYELIPPHFNQLLVFDDRIVHATPAIEGSMDPMEGRIALVGHIRATSPVFGGNIQRTEPDARRVILEALQHLRDRLRSYRDIQGTVAYKLAIGANGAVDSLSTLTDNIVTQLTGYDRSDAVNAVKLIIQQTMTGLRFTESACNSTVIVPVLIPVPDLRPIELVVPHESSRDAIRAWAQTYPADDHELELNWTWDGDAFSVRAPIAGSIRIEPRRIAALFDPPMWVPSQRERFQAALFKWMKAASTGAVYRDQGIGLGMLAT